MAKVKCEIEITGIKETINRYEQLSASFNQLPNYVENDIGLADLYCKQEMPIGATGRLNNSLDNTISMTASFNEIRAEILNNSEYAKYVEFGTGVVGQSSPHPDAKQQSYQYNIPTDFKDETGGWWWFDTKVTHKRQYTHGMKSRPFMYKTAKWLNEKLVKTILGVFKR